MARGILLPMMLPIIYALGQNWIFMGTQYAEFDGKGYTAKNKTADDLLRRYIQKTNPRLWNSIDHNFEKTAVKREHPRDKAYYNDKLLDHACPYTIRSSTETPRHRVPDVIGVGFAKCGTGALAFLDCHPHVTFRTTEPRFFTKEAMLDRIIRAHQQRNFTTLRHYRDIYARLLPAATTDEILIEKSPQYAGGEERLRNKRARAMKIINPNMKLIAMVCDPVRRAFSQLKMKDRRSKFKTNDGQSIIKCKACLKGSFEDAMRQFTATLAMTRRRGAESGYAAYGTYLESYLREFKREEILIVDGENMVRSPNDEWARILSFIEVTQKTFHFEVVEDKGFPCLDTPVPYCLNSSKGTSRKVDVFKHYKNHTDVWMETFRPSVMDSMKIFDQPVTESFCSSDGLRFDWTRKYVCALR